MTRRRLFAMLLMATCALASYFLASSPLANPNQAAQAPVPKYIFIFLADGAGITHLEITRMYNRVINKEGMIIPDKIMKEGSLGFLTTHAADSLITDSAAAATAMACGCKAKIGMLGMCEDGGVSKTIMELAKEKGMRIGLVTNSTIYDASPAAFAGHVPNRNFYSLIIDQYLKMEPDLLLGGGRDQFLPKRQPGSNRKDDIDMIASFKKQGYTYVSDKDELSRANGAKILGLFSLQDMSFEIDRDKDTEPSVSDMTQAAIRILEGGNRRGFVVFIENENIDTAGHLTDIASLIHAYREFDRAVGLAYEFYRRHPRETLILVTSDHETGGLGFASSLRVASTGQAKLSFGSPEDLKKIQSIRISIKKAIEILGERPSSEAVDKLMAEHFKGFVLAPEFKEAILKKKSFGPTFSYNTTAAALGAMVADNTQAYWSTAGHTNQPVFVAALGVGAERFRGYQDNTDFAKHLFALLEGRR